jgi:hypothetical protein
MVRLLIGSVVGGLVQFLIGAIAWLGFGGLAYRNATEAASADLQVSLARTLGVTGTGTYQIPMPETAAATTMLGRGPVALIFFNTKGFAPMDPGAMLTGLILSIVTMLLVGIALREVIGRVARLRVASLFAVALALYFVLSLPVYNFYLPWGWWVFLTIEELVAFGAGVFVLVRWFLPERAATTLH